MLGAKEEDPSTRELIVTVLVIIWAIRLSSFLFLRIHHTGKDGRFDDLKTSPVRFLIPWSLQGLWIFVTMNVVIVINSQSGTSPELTAWDAMGVVLWTAGFCVEVVADRQKSAFNAKPENEGRWIDEGLWSISRHPNYLGEILLWSGIALFGVPCFSGLEWAAWVSPVFVYLLLTKVSGVPILDRRGLEKWGEEPGYLEYRSTTPLLFPSLKRK
jgi:steroid 5-alpha reductase family enzyme